MKDLIPAKFFKPYKIDGFYVPRNVGSKTLQARERKWVVYKDGYTLEVFTKNKAALDFVREQAKKDFYAR
jgi:hypothetical protein